MIDLIIIGNNQIEKHMKYKEQYKSKTKYWGLGIENELYLEFANRKKVNKKFFLNNKTRERYSVDYFSNYKTEYLDEALKITLQRMGSGILFLPILLNSHSFTKADYKGNHKTLYKKDTPPNPDFIGKTLIEFLSEKDDFFSSQNDFWLFDGDTIEIINTNFYNVKLEKVINELSTNKKIFLEKLNQILLEENIYQEFGKVQFMNGNHPFAIYLTNQNNISMFNNGTIHLNLTLPSELDSNSMISNKELFISQHKKLIKLIQWLEPILITVYGSPDPFSTISNYQNKKCFSHCSQRNIVSRYISIGTYDTDTMETGKILTKPIDLLSVSKLEFWWYKQVHKSSAYNSLNQLGLDINFNKHWNHGVEIRFLDHISDQKLLQECFEFIIYLGDFILEKEKCDYINPIIDIDWNNLVSKIMLQGIYYSMSYNEIFIYENIFDFKIQKKNIVDVYYEIFHFLKNKYNKVYVSMSDNSYIIEPIGIFSSCALGIQKYKNKPNFINEIYKRENDNDCHKYIFRNEISSNIVCENNKNLTYENDELMTVKNFSSNYDLNDFISQSENEISSNIVCENNNINENKCCVIM